MSVQYCERCMRLCEDKCPKCRKVPQREPQVNDPVYLVTADAIQGAFVEDVLGEHHIPFMKRGLLGAGVTAYIGQMLEDYEYFVPFGAYAQASELVGGFGPADEVEEPEE